MNTIAFIGAGNMARALIGGLIAHGVDPSTMWATNRSTAKLDSIAKDFAINIATDNNQAAAQADVLVLAVKPNQAAEVCRQLASTIANKQPLIISVMSAVSIEKLLTWLGGDYACVRAMPNTPASIGLGATGLFASMTVSDSQRQQADTIFHAVGITVWLSQESQIDAIVAVSGSSPAYIFLFMEAMQQAAGALGLSSTQAADLVKQTVLGAAQMAAETNVDVTALRKAVTSPGGNTEKAITVFEQGQLRQLVADAMTAACKQSEKMAQEFE